jgi:hypothetical protein
MDFVGEASIYARGWQVALPWELVRKTLARNVKYRRILHLSPMERSMQYHGRRMWRARLPVAKNFVQNLEDFLDFTERMH